MQDAKGWRSRVEDGVQRPNQEGGKAFGLVSLASLQHEVRVRSLRRPVTSRRYTTLHRMPSALPEGIGNQNLLRLDPHDEAVVSHRGSRGEGRQREKLTSEGKMQRKEREDKGRDQLTLVLAPTRIDADVRDSPQGVMK